MPQHPYLGNCLKESKQGSLDSLRGYDPSSKFL